MAEFTAYQTLAAIGGKKELFHFHSAPDSDEDFTSLRVPRLFSLLHKVRSARPPPLPGSAPTNVFVLML